MIPMHNVCIVVDALFGGIVLFKLKIHFSTHSDNIHFTHLPEHVVIITTSSLS